MTRITRSVWSKEVETARPSLSGLQSKLDIGWVERPTFWSSCKLPATPISCPFSSFATLFAGYLLKYKIVNDLKSNLMLIDSDTLTISINTSIQLRHSSWKGRDSVANVCLAIQSSRAPSRSLIRIHRDRRSGFACRKRGFSTLVLLLLAYSWLCLCGQTRDNIP